MEHQHLVTSNIVIIAILPLLPLLDLTTLKRTCRLFNVRCNGELASRLARRVAAFEENVAGFYIALAKAGGFIHGSVALKFATPAMVNCPKNLNIVVAPGGTTFMTEFFQELSRFDYF